MEGLQHVVIYVNVMIIEQQVYQIRKIVAVQVLAVLKETFLDHLMVTWGMAVK
ncbi:hypothetical protein [uncultured Chryseobacterium sp.]|uniref:hypothetical protein n=1 Tax=uncultured Chryseobacterium sp. TaxID=259322 RepID=UPI00258635FA|nr:hypothetical protein [uncultured Chryseobacterium sp.]